MNTIRSKFFVIGIVLFLTFIFTSFAQAKDKKAPKAKTRGKLIVTSPAFKENTMIPGRFSCAGLDVSPPIEWTGVPKGTKSFALLLEDPDAPWGIYTHWVIFNIPADYRKLKEAIVQADTLDCGAVQGKNSANKTGYLGPCPPGSSSHRYHFKLYALDTKLPLSSRAQEKDVLEAMKGHILSEGSLVGLYKRK